MIPDTIGAYRIVRELGHGGQGTVYLADDSKLGRRVALKILPGTRGLSLKSMKRFRREAEITARLDHPGICTTYDFGETDGVAWIAMRYVEGETLSARLAAARQIVSPVTSEHLSFVQDVPTTSSDSGSRTPSTVSHSRSREEIAWVVHVIEQTARALHAAHEHGVIHRDMKPANIMVTPEDNTVILDFGLANVLEPDGPSLTKTGELMGTPQYMAPEQLTRDAIQLDRRTDIYSLGITLYEALTLVRPFDMPTRERIYQAILAKDPPDPHRVNPAISRDLSAVVATAIEKDRDRRYQTALEFAEDLRRTIAREPVRARRAGPVARLVKWAERNPAVAAFASALLVVLVSALIFTTSLLRTRSKALDDYKHSLTEIQRLSDVTRVHNLKRDADLLFPILPETAARMKRWLDDARGVLSRVDEHRQRLAAMGASTPDERPEDQWKREVLTDLIKELEILGDPHAQAGNIADLDRLLAFAESVREDTVVAYEPQWSLAIAAIKQSPVYGGLDLPPQVGLVPLGRNAESGLWEFAQFGSGTIPDTDGENAAFQMDDDTTIILVLIPRARFTMGSPPGEIGSATDNSEVQHDETVEAFFAGKYEVTCSQWDSVFPPSPSASRPARSNWSSPTHPAHDMTWFRAADFARRLNLALLTGAQWERACRAGKNTAFAYGNDIDSLRGKVNVMDLSFEKFETMRSGMTRVDWDDGFPYAAPVDAFPPNGFGIYGVNGNVQEWTADSGPSGKERFVRDGSWLLPAHFGRSAARRPHAPDNHVPSIGMRVGRAIVP